MRHVFQVIGQFNYLKASMEFVLGQADSLEKAQEQIPELCKLYMDHKRGSDTFNSTFFIREVWTDSIWNTPYRANYIESILKSKYYESK